MVNDLRSFLDQVRRDKPRDVFDVRRRVSPKYETAAIITKLEHSFRFPIVVFHEVEGSAVPLVTNVCGSMARLALALGCPVSEISRCHAARCSQPVKPQVVANAPVQECVATGPRVNLEALPQLTYHENDAQRPYITAAIMVGRDPETGHSNLSYHRLMILNRSTTAIFMVQGKHLDQIYRKYEKAGEAMPVAAFIGVHPLCSLGAVYAAPDNVDEYDIIGGLQQCPLHVTKCLSNALHVPAHAEFVLEGVIPPRTRIEEGPFGEFTGYSTGRTCCPLFNVEAITSRRDPLFQDIVSGKMEHLLLPVLSMEHHLLQVARAAVPNVANLRVMVPLTAFVSVIKTDDRQPECIIRTLLANEIYIKQVVVVDADVELSDLRQIATAVALHVRPDRDMYVLEGMPGTQLDPSCESDDGTTAKFGIDATMPMRNTQRVRQNRVPQQLLDSINLSDLLGTPATRSESGHAATEG